MASEHFLDHSDGYDRVTILLDRKEVLLEVDSVVVMRLHLVQSSWHCLVMNRLMSLRISRNCLPHHNRHYEMLVGGRSDNVLSQGTKHALAVTSSSNYTQ